MCNSVCFKHDHAEVFMTEAMFFFTMEHVHIITRNLGITIVFVVLLLQEFDS